MGKKHVYNHGKKGLDIKNTPGLNMQEKSPFYKNVSDLISFSQDLGLFSWFFSLDLFSSGL